MTALPEYQDFKAPWEKSGSECDPEKAKRFIFTLQKQNEGLEAKVTTVTAERDEFKGKVDEIVRKDETEVERLKRENEELKAKPAETVDSTEVLKLRVALKKGLTETQAKRLIGATETELEADADALVESFGGNGAAEDEVDGKTPAHRTPRPPLNPNDPNPNDGKDVSWKDVADLIPRI